MTEVPLLSVFTILMGSQLCHAELIYRISRGQRSALWDAYWKGRKVLIFRFENILRIWLKIDRTRSHYRMPGPWSFIWEVQINTLPSYHIVADGFCSALNALIRHWGRITNIMVSNDLGDQSEAQAWISWPIRGLDSGSWPIRGQLHRPGLRLY